MRYTDPIYSRRLGKSIKQVNKTSANKAYDAGTTVYLLPALCAIDNHWISFCRLNKENKAWSGVTFNSEVAEYTFYNCCSELGKYPIFFIAAE